MRYKTKVILATHIPIISVVGVLMYMSFKNDSVIYMGLTLLLSMIGIQILIYQNEKFAVDKENAQ